MRHDNHSILRTAVRDAPLPVLARQSVNVPGNRRGTDEGHSLNISVLYERLYNLLSSVDYVENSGRKAHLVRYELRSLLYRHWSDFAWLHHDAVTKYNCVRYEPEWYHQGKVERTDNREDPQRLLSHSLVNPRGDLVECVTFRECVGDGDRYINVLDGSSHLSLALLNRLSVILTDDRREFLEVSLEGSPHPEEVFEPLRHGNILPPLEGLSGCVYRSRHLFIKTKRYFCDDLAQRRIECFLLFLGLGVHPITVDQKLQSGIICHGLQYTCHSTSILPSHA